MAVPPWENPVGWPRARHDFAAEGLAIFALGYWPLQERATFYPDMAAIDYLRSVQSHDRLVADGITLYAPASTFYGLRHVTGHGFHSVGWKELLLGADPGSFGRGPTFSGIRLSSGEVHPAVLDRLGARFEVYGMGAPIPGVPSSSGLPTVRVRSTTTTPLEVPISSSGLRGVVVSVVEPVGHADQITSLTVEAVDGPRRGGRHERAPLDRTVRGTPFRTVGRRAAQ